MATRQIKMPQRDGSEDEIEEAPHSVSGQRAVGICSKWIGKRKVPIRQRKPLKRRRWSSRRAIRSCRCRCMTVSATWSCRSCHVNLSAADLPVLRSASDVERYSTNRDDGRKNLAVWSHAYAVGGEVLKRPACAPVSNEARRPSCPTQL
jgi:hypothetical protein